MEPPDSHSSEPNQVAHTHKTPRAVSSTVCRDPRSTAASWMSSRLRHELPSCSLRRLAVSRFLSEFNMTTNPDTSEILRVLRLGVGPESYGLDMSAVAGVYGSDQLKPDPTSDDHAGWLRSQTGDVPVFRLARLLDVASANDSDG